MEQGTRFKVQETRLVILLVPEHFGKRSVGRPGLIV